jgi:hypothetical protein
VIVYPKNVTARIKSISGFGGLEIVFNNSMKTENVTLKDLE